MKEFHPRVKKYSSFPTAWEKRSSKRNSQGAVSNYSVQAFHLVYISAELLEKICLLQVNWSSSNLNTDDTPACRQAGIFADKHGFLQGIYKNRFSFIYRSFPISIHQYNPCSNNPLELSITMKSKILKKYLCTNRKSRRNGASINPT